MEVAVNQTTKFQPLGKKMARRLSSEEINMVSGGMNTFSDPDDPDDPTQGCQNSRSCTTQYAADLPDCD